MFTSKEIRNQFKLEIEKAQLKIELNPLDMVLVRDYKKFRMVF